MATLRIVRSDEWINYTRKISVFIDGKEVGKISNGETKGFEIGSGNHILKAKIDWCSSGEISFSADENNVVTFRLSSFADGSWLYSSLTSGYYLTFGAKQYLNLRKINYDN